MDTNIQIFKNDRFGEVRVTELNDEPMFAAKDVAKALGYSDNTNVSTATSFIPDEWKGVFPINTPYGNQEIMFVTEKGLYFWLGRCDKPNALPYQKWLASDVLPSIRKHGGYHIHQKPLTQIEILVQSAQLLAEQEKRLSSIENSVDVILQRQANAEHELLALPTSGETVPEMSINAKIRQLVNRYCAATGMYQQFVWDKVYETLYYNYHIALKSCKKINEKESWLDVAERRGCLDKIYAIISDLVVQQGLTTI